MDPELQTALAAVLRDLRTTGAPQPARFDDSDWDESAETATAMLWSRDGSGVGIRMTRHRSPVDQVVEVTDQVQEWAVEELGHTDRTNWPPCPRHPRTHPMQVVSNGGDAWWECPRDAVLVAEVGALG